VATRSVPRHRAQAVLAGLVTAICSAAVSSGTAAANAQRAARHWSPQARDLPQHRQHTASAPGAGTVVFTSPGVRAPARGTAVARRATARSESPPPRPPGTDDRTGPVGQLQVPPRKSAWTWVSITRSICRPARRPPPGRRRRHGTDQRRPPAQEEAADFTGQLPLSNFKPAESAIPQNWIIGIRHVSADGAAVAANIRQGDCG
jgi:hypothetical protein